MCRTGEQQNVEINQSNIPQSGFRGFDAGCHGSIIAPTERSSSLPLFLGRQYQIDYKPQTPRTARSEPDKRSTTSQIKGERGPQPSTGQLVRPPHIPRHQLRYGPIGRCAALQPCIGRDHGGEHIAALSAGHRGRSLPLQQPPLRPMWPANATKSSRFLGDCPPRKAVCSCSQPRSCSQHHDLVAVCPLHQGLDLSSIRPWVAWAGSHFLELFWLMLPGGKRDRRISGSVEAQFCFCAERLPAHAACLGCMARGDTGHHRVCDQGWPVSSQPAFKQYHMHSAPPWHICSALLAFHKGQNGLALLEEYIGFCKLAKLSAVCLVLKHNFPALSAGDCCDKLVLLSLWRHSDYDRISCVVIVCTVCQCADLWSRPAAPRLACTV